MSDVKNWCIPVKRLQRSCRSACRLSRGLLRQGYSLGFRALNVYESLCLESKRMLMAIIPPALRNLSLLQEIKDA